MTCHLGPFRGKYVKGDQLFGNILQAVLPEIFATSPSTAFKHKDDVASHVGPHWYQPPNEIGPSLSYPCAFGDIFKECI